MNAKFGISTQMLPKKVMLYPQKSVFLLTCVMQFKQLEMEL